MPSARQPRRGVAGQAGAIVANQNQTADGGGVDRAGSAPAEQASAPGAGADTRLDTDDIFRSIGEVPYDWRLDSDVLQWGPNAGPVLGISDIGTIASGRGFAQLVDPKSGPTRSDAVVRSTTADEGKGVPYQIEYALRPPTGLFGIDMRLRLKRTALPPAGVTPRLRTGRPTTELALRLLALIQALTVSPSLRARSSARHKSMSAPDVGNGPDRRAPSASVPAVRIRWMGLRQVRGAGFIQQ